MGDLLVVMKAALLFVGGLYFKGLVRGTAGDGKDLSRDISLAAFRVSIFTASLVILNHGFMLYRGAAVIKALLFFIFGIAGIFSCFYTFDGDKRQFNVTYAVYAPVSKKTFLFRASAALLLAILGVFFIKSSHPVLAVTSYVFLTLQLLLVLKQGIGENEGSQTSIPPQELKVSARIISIVMIACALYLYYYSFIYLQAFNIRISMITLFTGALLFGWAGAGSDYDSIETQDKKSVFYDIIFPILIFGTALVILGYKLMDIPPGLHGDEVLSINMAASLGKGDIMPVVLDSQGYNGMTLLYYWMLAMLGKVFGTTIITGRWFSVFTGAAGLVFVYMLVKEIFNRRAAVITAMLLSTFFMMVFYSRNALLWIHVPAFAAASYYFFFKAVKSGKNRYFIISGIVLSMDLCFYSAGKAAPFAIFAWIALMYVRAETRRMIISNWKGIALMIFTMFLIFLPVINYIFSHPDLYFLRMNGMNFLKNYPSLTEKITALTENIIRNIQMFMTISANGYCHNLPQKPFFDAFTAFAAISGAGYLIFTWKKSSSSFVILWVLFGLLPGFLSRLGVEDPYPARTVLAIPAVIIVVSLGVERVIAKLESLWPKYLKLAAFLCAAYFIAWFSFYNIRNYFILFPNDPHTQTYYRYDDRLNAEYMINNTGRNILISPFFNSNYYYGMEKELSSPYFQQYVTSYDVSLFDLSTVYGTRPATIIGEGIYYKMFPIYREYFPNAKVKVLWDPNFWFLDTTSNIKYCYEWKYPDKTIAMNYIYAWFSVYDNDVKIVRLARAEISQQDINDTFNLNGEFFRSGEKPEMKKVYFPVKTGDFSSAVISGLLEVPDYGVYDFKFVGAPGDLFIDGSRVKGGEELYKGLHSIRITLGNEKTGEFSLLWKSAAETNYSAIDRKYLIDSEKIFGLITTYRNKGRIIYRELEPSIDYRTYYYKQRPAYAFTTNNGYDIEWNGKIYINSNDIYSFKMHTLYDALITIDGTVVYKKENGVEHFTQIKLDKGMKKLIITSPYTYISNLWDPGSTVRFMYKDTKHREFMPVTYDMLRP
jgi:hypothetical protein